MTNVAIPDWNAQGLLPPINPAAPTSFDRSPYQISLTDFVLRYATSPERSAIIDGFLKFRAALHAVSLVQGFQWVDGSFLEHIELIEKRSPRDVDVVTFYHLCSGQTQQNLLTANPQLFFPQNTKQVYQVDAYFVQLNQPSPEPLVRQSAYWYSLWSHRRNDLWKGYLQVDLAPGEDLIAQTSLDAKQVEVGGQS
jgi:hypothetical protein